MACSSYRIVNNSDKPIYFDYQRCDNSMWEYQVPVPVGQSSNFWSFEGTVRYPKFYNDLIEFQELSDAPPTNITNYPEPQPINGLGCYNFDIYNQTNERQTIEYIDCYGVTRFSQAKPGSSYTLTCVRSISLYDENVIVSNQQTATCPQQACPIFIFSEDIKTFQYDFNSNTHINLGIVGLVGSAASTNEFLWNGLWNGAGYRQLWKNRILTFYPQRILSSRVNYETTEKQIRFLMPTLDPNEMYWITAPYQGQGSWTLYRGDISSTNTTSTSLFTFPGTPVTTYFNPYSETLIIVNRRSSTNFYLEQWDLEGNLMVQSENISSFVNTTGSIRCGLFSEGNLLFLINPENKIYLIDDCCNLVYVQTIPDFSNQDKIGIFGSYQPIECCVATLPIPCPPGRTFQLNYNTTGQTEACLGFSISCENCYYYTEEVMTGITEGMVLYTDVSLETLAPAGYYAGGPLPIVVDELEGFRIVSAGTVSEIVICPSPTPTPTNTPTVTPTVTPTPSATTPESSPTPTNTSTPTVTPTPSTTTPESSPTPTNTSTPTNTPTPSVTIPEPTPTPTPSPTPECLIITSSSGVTLSQCSGDTDRIYVTGWQTGVTFTITTSTAVTFSGNQVSLGGSVTESGLSLTSLDVTVNSIGGVSESLFIECTQTTENVYLYYQIAVIPTALDCQQKILEIYYLVP